MIIFVGLAGSGKSIQGRLLTQSLEAKYFSMGEFLRSHVDPVIQKKMLTGELVSDEEVIAVINEEFPRERASDPEYILDGFPRTFSQAEWLIDKAKKGRYTIRAIIHLTVSKETIIARLLERKRPDDHMEAIGQRIKEYNDAILPIIEIMKQAGVKVFEVNAEKSIEEVHITIVNNLKQSLNV